MGSYFELSLRIWMEEGIMDKGSVRGDTGHPPFGEETGQCHGSDVVIVIPSLSHGSL